MIRIPRISQSLASAAALAASLAGFAAPTHAGGGPVPGTQCFSASINLQSTDWSQSMTFPKFDPALGQLVSIDFTLNGHIEGAVRVESTDGSPTTISTSFQAQITLTRPDLSVIVITIPISNFLDSLAPFDGVIDFAGPSGESHLNLTANASNGVTSPPPLSDLVLFTGLPNAPGTISLPVTAIGTSNAMGSGNLVTSFTTAASASCDVCYHYINHPPDFSLCAGNLMASIGVPFSTQVCALDTDPNDTVTLTVTGLPAGATLTPPLPASGNPICTTMNWTPNNGDAGNHVIIFTATDNHGNQSFCTLNLLVAECHQLFGLQNGNHTWNLFGHLYDTQIASLTSAFPVTREEIPDFQIPQPHVRNGLTFYSMPFYVQVVMYNPEMFPQNPSQWSKAMRVTVQPNGSLDTVYFGTANGIGVRAQLFTNGQGQQRMRFPFGIAGRP